MHVMLDLETMGTGPNAPIVAIGACRFDNNSVVGDTFYRKVSLASAVKCGAQMDADTVIWWLGQSADARGEIISAQGKLEEALRDFAVWIDDFNLDGLWGNGASFDNVILGQAYRNLEMSQPWPFWADRCYRTVKAFSKVEMDRTGTHHNALDDAISQARHLIEIWKEEQ